MRTGASALANPGAAHCACGAVVGPSFRFCKECGVARPRHAAAVTAAVDEPPDLQAEGPPCLGCGAPLADPQARFCRRCGHRVQRDEEPGHGLASARGGSDAGSGAASEKHDGKAAQTRCRSCGKELGAGRKFCPSCGALASAGRSDQLAEAAPAWYRVVEGLSRVWWGTLTLVIALVFVAAASTLLNLFSLDRADGGLRAALLGAGALGVALGLALLLWGDLLDLGLPSLAKGRWHALVVFLCGAGASLTGLLALGRLAAQGFDLDKAPRSAEVLGALAFLLLVSRLVAFATLLRRLAFALRNYRIAQGSEGFILYVGVGLALVGLLGLLFREASSSAQTFGELIALAFVSGMALWALSLARRSRDLVRQRLV